jgi:hypothetical protein
MPRKAQSIETEALRHVRYGVQDNALREVQDCRRSSSLAALWLHFTA